MPESNGEVAAMIEAEVNEGGPPSSAPCDTPADVISSRSSHAPVSETSPTVEVCPAPDRILHLPLGAAVKGARSMTVLTSAGLELVRLVIPAGKRIPPHRAPDEITVQCLEGHVAFSHDGHELELWPGDLLHLCPKELHSLKGIADSSVLVTLLRPRAV
jgi:quercetin dioxygenase-like cupin family protein